MASSYYDTYPQDPARHPSISASSLHEGDNDAVKKNNNKNSTTNKKQIPFSFPRKYVSSFLYPCRYVIVVMWLGAVVAGSFFALSFLNETTLEFDPPAGTPARIALDAKQNAFSSVNQSYQPTSDMAIVIYFDQDFLTSSSSLSTQRIYSLASDGTKEGSISLPYNISKITEVPSVSAFVDVLNFELLEAAKEFHVVASNHDKNASTLQVQIGNYYLLELAGAHALSSSLLSKTASNALVVPLLLFCEFTSMTCRNYAAKVVEIAQKVENSFLHNETLNTNYNYSSVINKMIGSADSPPPSSDSHDAYSFAAKYNLTASQVQLLSNALRHGTTGMPMLLTSFVDQIQKELGNMDMITLPIALVVMALTVKSLRLLLIPIVSIALTLLIGFSSMYGVAKFLIPVSSAAPPLMLTLAIATGIDYNLFLLTRFADEIRAEEEDDDDEENDYGDDQKGKPEKKRLNNNNGNGDDSQVSSPITSASPSNLSKPGGAFGNQQQKQQNAMNAISPNSGAYYGATDDDLQFIQYSISKSIAPNQQQDKNNNNNCEGQENSESSKLIVTRRKRRDLSKPRKNVNIQKVIANVLRTAGGTVLISGLTLAASFVALIFFPTNILKSFGIACSGTIAVALLVSLNLTPTLLLIFENFFKEGAHAKIWQFVEKKTGDSSSSVCCLYKFTPFVWLCSCFGIEIEIYDEESDDQDKQHQQKSSSPLRTGIVSKNNNEENSDGENEDDDEENNNASSQPPLPRSSYMSNGSPTTSDVYDLDPELTALEIVRLKMQQKQQKLEQRQRFKLNQQKEQQIEQKRKEELEKVEKQKQEAAATAAVIPKGKQPGGKKKKKIIKKKKNDDDDNVDADGCVSIVADYRKYHEHSEPEKQEDDDENDDEEEQQKIENNYSSKFPTHQSGKPINNNNNTRKSAALFESPDVYNVYQSETDNTSNDKTSSSDDEEVREAKKKRRDARERKKNHKMPLDKSRHQQQQQKYSPEMHEEKEEANKTNNRLNNNNSKAYGALADSFSFALSAAAADAENEKRKTRQEEEEEENIRMQNEKHPLLNLRANKPEKRKKIDMSAIFSRFKSHLPSFQNEKEQKSKTKSSNSKKNRSDENDVVLVSSINSDHLYESSIFRHIEKILTFPWNFIIFLLFCGLIGFCGSKVAQLRIEDSTLAFLAKGTYPYTSYVTLQEYFGGGAMMPYRILFTSSSSLSSTSSIYSQEFVSFAHSIITNISAATNTPLFLFRGLYAIDGKLVDREDFTNCLDFIENKTSNSTCDPNVLLMMLNSQIVNHDESAAIVLMTCPIHPTSSQGTTYYNTLLSAISQVEQQQQQSSPANANFNAYVLGLAAETVDAMKVVFDHFPLIGAISMLVVVLMVSVTFRSVVVPIRCIISILFTEVFVFGLSVLVYQDGDLNSLNWSYLSGHQSILWLTPIVAYSFLLGVALDFDIFLLTRIVEIITVEKKRTANATVRGLCGTITIINACGFVMTIAFSGLFFSNIRVLNELGFMLVVAVLFDTFIVRTLLVPCVMSMLGRMHWWPNNLEAVIDQLEKDVKLQSEFEGRYDKKTGEVRVPLEVHEGSGLLSLAAMK